MIKWVKILYNDFKLYNVNNGFSANPFCPTRGLFQGNPFSQTGFILMIELLALMIRNNDKIKGINVNGLIHLLSMFADDMDIFIQNEETSCNELFKVISRFEEASGLKINYDKTTVYRIGSAREAMARVFSLRKLHWSDGPVNILGINICENRDQMEYSNYESLFEFSRNYTKLSMLSTLYCFIVKSKLIAKSFPQRD